ncbi:MAG: methylmalonyl Co-A mutase-associated GTPase MeaB [Calditrichaceae bacterium]|nr:methylmalonyl Co-A mutase-associated GTPase MeaB [Calditrichaceae bacterium]HES59604.1 methylmalonyl Co-A mutase-associated GTPase MeaB [Caldithrix sp.]
MIELSENVIKGQSRAVARAISWIENDHEMKESLIDQIYPYCGKAVVWGITGPPGSGKSSLVDHLIFRMRAVGKKVAVIAVDPSSPFSGGAILGDRIRMQKHATDEGVFIRSMASRGHLGGVSGATSDAIKVLDAAGYDLILIETIGVGQTEIEVMELSDVVLLVLVPGLGDEIQALKAGVMEIGDVFVVNKSDRDDADKVRAEVKYILEFKEQNGNYIENPVVMTSAKLNEGIDQLLKDTENYLHNINLKGQLEARRKLRILNEINRIISGKIEEELKTFITQKEKLDNWIEKIYQKKCSPYSFVNENFKTFLKEYKKP